MSDDLVKRFEDKISPEPNSGCWLWAASGTLNGYGKFWNGKKDVLAHRFSYEYFVGPIPEGLQIDHSCRVRCCVNPDHLQPVTQSENTRRGLSPHIGRTINLAKTHCPQGHPYAGENLYVFPDGRRGCRACSIASTYRTRARRHAALEGDQ